MRFKSPVVAGYHVFAVAGTNRFLKAEKIEPKH
jgi:hypothetical protein